MEWETTHSKPDTILGQTHYTREVPKVNRAIPIPPPILIPGLAQAIQEYLVGAKQISRPFPNRQPLTALDRQTKIQQVARRVVNRMYQTMPLEEFKQALQCAKPSSTPTPDKK